ncbi:MAG: SPOR domain-containing protein [Gammaproteobacteria bacterium]
MRHNSPLSWLLLGAWCLTLAGCASPEEQAFKHARMTDTVVAWEEFLRRYPEGDTTAKARQRLAELHEDREWQRAGLANTVPAYQQYLRGYPQGRFATEALVRIANLNLQAVPDHDPTEEELRAARAAALPDEAVVTPTKPAAATGALIQRSSPVPVTPLAKQATVKPVPAKLSPAAPPVATPPKPVAVKPVPARPSPAATPVAKPAPAKPATVKPAPAATSPAPAPVAPAATNIWSMQLGAFAKGEAAARAHWQKLLGRVPALTGLTPEVAPPTDDRGFYRLRVVGLEQARARELCEAIRAAGEGCLVTAR